MKGSGCALSETRKFPDAPVEICHCGICHAERAFHMSPDSVVVSVNIDNVAL